MDNNITILSKVFVYETDKNAATIIKSFCERNHLIGVTGSPENVKEVLKTNVDFGAAFICGSIDNDLTCCLNWIELIHNIRRELPIFIRTNTKMSIDEIPEQIKHVIAGVYHIDDLVTLKNLVDSYLFETQYPGVLVRGFMDISIDAIQSQFKGFEVILDLPYVVNDVIIHGDVFSLMPVESTWCRGYMMLQIEEDGIMDLIKKQKTHISSHSPSFHDVNAVLGEISNLMWGAIKARFIVDKQPDEEASSKTQVPIIINHFHQYISFGSGIPQLCFKYTLFDMTQEIAPIVFYQKFIFNLSWNPENFVEHHSVDEFVETGELELF